MRSAGPFGDRHLGDEHWMPRQKPSDLGSWVGVHKAGSVGPATGRAGPRGARRAPPGRLRPKRGARRSGIKTGGHSGKVGETLPTGALGKSHVAVAARCFLAGGKSARIAAFAALQAPEQDGQKMHGCSVFFRLLHLLRVPKSLGGGGMWGDSGSWGASVPSPNTCGRGGKASRGRRRPPQIYVGGAAPPRGRHSPPR